MLRRWWPLGAVVLVQLAILVAIPLRRVEARLSGTEVTLRTVPVDPYDVLSGYYVTLRYEGEDTISLALPSGGDTPTEWLVVEPASPAWKAVQVPPETGGPKPAVGPGQVAIRLHLLDRHDEPCSIPSACRFYIPEARREAVAEAMRKAGGRALVDMRVDGRGDVALLRLRVGDLVLAN